jgi:hypothetical protein
LDGLAFPQKVRVVLGERRRGDPIGEGEPAAASQYAERLGHRPPPIGNAKQSLLADHDIDALVGDGSCHDVAFDDLNPLLKADELRQHVGAPDARRREFDAGDKGAITARQIARWTPEPGAEIRDPRALADSRGCRQNVVRVQPSIVILIVRIEVLEA